MDNREYLKIFELMVQGMIEKDRVKLEKSMSKNARLYHMTGRCETREEYICNILDGTLNYYDYEIISFNKNNSVIKLLAKVYGGAKTWWTLSMQTTFIFEDENLKILECRVDMA